MPRRLFRVFLVALVVAFLLPAGAPAAPARPNILFVLSDDHATHALSCYGSVLNRTPHLDRIASSGMRFGNCFVVNSICTPSRAAILTGQYSHKNGVTVFNRFDGSRPHLAKHLQAGGYQTAIVGKWHLFSDPTGFDYWNVLPGQGLYHNPVFIENGKTNKHQGYVSDLIADFSLDWLKQRDPSRPFCLMMNPKAPHREWSPPARYTNLFAGTNLPLPATFDDDYAGRSQAATEATMRMSDLRPTDLKAPVPAGLSPEQEKQWRYQQYIKDYLRVVQAMDDSVGRVLDYLEATGLRSNTVVVYSSDQGFFLGDHGWFDKRFMYEESLRMPLLISWPGRIAPGSLNSNMVLNVDFAPTLLDLAGLPVPDYMQGRSFAPALRGEQPANWRTSMYYRYYHYPADHQVQPHLGVRTERFKLIHFNKLDEWELYDLWSDPREMKNLYADPARAGLVAELKTELARLRRELDDRDQFAEELGDGEKLRLVPLQQVFASSDIPLPPATLVDGRKGKALRLQGGQSPILPANGGLNPAGKPFTMGSWCLPESPDGVILSLGGGTHGFSLFLQDGLPCVAVRTAGGLAIVRGNQRLPLNEWHHVAAVLNARAELRLFVNGKPAGSVKCNGITAKPAETFSLGSDPGGRVGPYETALQWKGLLEDARLYWGELEKNALDAWAAR